MATVHPPPWGDENIYFTLGEGHNLDVKSTKFLYNKIFMCPITI